MDYPPEDQYLAMMRAYVALKEASADAGPTAEMGYAPEDAAKKFFQECYALKDWLVKDPRIRDPRNVETYVTGSIPLSIAADVCNSYKHAGLTRKPRGAGQPDRVKVEHTLLMPAGPPGADIGSLHMTRNPRDGDTLRLGTHSGLTRAISSARVVLEIAGREYDALATAADCVAAWDHYLQMRGLKFSKA